MARSMLESHLNQVRRRLVLDQLLGLVAWSWVIALSFGVVWLVVQPFVFAGLSEAVASLEKSSATRRHIVLLTDGWSRSGQYDDLIERMAGIKTERKLFEMRYSIDAQKPVDYPGITPTGALDLVTNRMQLDMLLLHEQDFLNFLNDLQRSRQAYVSVRHCDIARNDRPATGPTVSPTLKSECTVDLINLVEAQPS